VFHEIIFKNVSYIPLIQKSSVYLCGASVAVFMGHMNLLKWIKSIDTKSFLELQLFSQMVDAAAINKKLDILNYLSDFRKYDNKNCRVYNSFLSSKKYSKEVNDLLSDKFVIV
jgi:hypothetical protein